MVCQSSHKYSPNYTQSVWLRGPSLYDHIVPIFSWLLPASDKLLCQWLPQWHIRSDMGVWAQLATSGLNQNNVSYVNHVSVSSPSRNDLDISSSSKAYGIKMSSLQMSRPHWPPKMTSYHQWPESDFWHFHGSLQKCWFKESSLSHVVVLWVLGSFCGRYLTA